MKHIYRIVGLFCLISSAAALFAADRKWPDESGRMSGPFGDFRNHRFSEGLSFVSEGQRVTAWGDGEVIWTTDGQSRLGSVPDRRFIVIEHGDGFRTSYNGVDPRPDLDRRVSGGDWLGYSEGDHWLFSVKDVNRARIVDPLSMLPSREGLSPLTIGDVDLVRGNDRTPVADRLAIPSGRWTVSVDLPFSPGRAVRNEISLYWVGELLGRVRFISMTEGPEGVVLEVPDQKAIDALYDDLGRLLFPGLIINTGRGTLELRVTDENGRVVTRSWNIVVQ